MSKKSIALFALVTGLCPAFGSTLDPDHPHISVKRLDLCTITLASFVSKSNLDLLQLPPMSHRSLLGLFFETEVDEEVLGIAEYLSSHDKIIESAESSNTFYKIKRYFWGGEILIENRTEKVGNGQIAIANETSGTLSERENKKDTENKVRNLKRVLASDLPELLAPHFEGISFDPNRRHLDPFLDSVQMDKKDNLRHRIGASTFILGSLKKLALLAKDPEGLQEGSLDEIRLVHWVISFLIRTNLDQQKEHRKNYEQQLELLNKLIVEKNLSLEDWKVVDPSIVNKALGGARPIHFIVFPSKPQNL